MSINNLNSVHLSEEQKKEIEMAISSLENLLKPLLANLTAEERSKFGSVNEQNKLVIHKAFDFAKNQPNLRTPDVDWDEFFRDFDLRKFCENTINRLENLNQGIKNRKILADYDNLQDALTDYSYTNYKAGTNAPNYEDKQREYKQFFAKGKRKTTEKPKETPENTSNTPSE